MNITGLIAPSMKPHWANELYTGWKSKQSGISKDCGGLGTQMPEISVSARAWELSGGSDRCWQLNEVSCQGDFKSLDSSPE